jgi:hypothetical protein
MMKKDLSIVKKIGVCAILFACLFILDVVLNILSFFTSDIIIPDIISDSICIIIYLMLLSSIVPCLRLMRQTHQLIMAAQKTHGTVVNHICRISEVDDSKTYALNVEYFDQNGLKHLIESSSSAASIFSSGNPDKDIGVSIIVLTYGDGLEPKLLLFNDLFMLHWLWLCSIIGASSYFLGQSGIYLFLLGIGMAIGGTTLGQGMMEELYL